MKKLEELLNEKIENKKPSKTENTILILKRYDDRIFNQDNKELKILSQNHKSGDNRTLIIKDEKNNNNREYLSLKKITQGINYIELSPKKEKRIFKSKEKYQLNDDEKNRIDEIDNQIKKLENEKNEIIEKSKSRYIDINDISNIDISQLDDDKKSDIISKLENYINLLNNK